MGSDESHFNVSLIVRDKVTNKIVSTNHNLSEEKGDRAGVETPDIAHPRKRTGLALHLIVQFFTVQHVA